MAIEFFVYSVTRAYRFAYAYSLGNGLAVEDQLKVEDIELMAKKLGEIGVKNSFLTGVGLTGEPYARNDMDNIVRVFGDYNLGSIYVKTDGLLIGRDSLRVLSRYGVKVILELGGPKDVDIIIRGNGFYEKSIDIARTLANEGVLYSLSIPLTKYVVKRLNDVLEVMLKLNVGKVSFPTLIPQPLVFHREHILNKLKPLEPTPWEREEFLKNVYRINKNLGGRIWLLPYDIFYHRILKSQEPQLQLEIPCELYLNQVRYNWVEVLDNGDIYVCSALGLKFGNIMYVNSIHEVFSEMRKSEYIRRLTDRNNIIGKCGYCNFYNVCAGCRARAYQYTGNLFVSDPACPYTLAR